MRKAVMILLALLAIRLLPRALRQQARALQLITLLFELTATAVANTSKTYAVEARTGNLETRVGNLEQGKISNLQSNSLIGQLNRGIFGDVQGNTVTMTAASSSTLHCQALGQLSDTGNTSFLATLSQCANPGGDLGQDPFTGSTWGSGERGYINNTIIRLNNVLNSLQNHHFMAS